MASKAPHRSDSADEAQPGCIRSAIDDDKLHNEQMDERGVKWAHEELKARRARETPTPLLDRATFSPVKAAADRAEAAHEAMREREQQSKNFCAISIAAVEHEIGELAKIANELHQTSVKPRDEQGDGVQLATQQLSAVQERIGETLCEYIMKRNPELADELRRDHNLPVAKAASPLERFGRISDAMVRGKHVPDHDTAARRIAASHPALVAAAQL